MGKRKRKYQAKDIKQHAVLNPSVVEKKKLARVGAHTETPVAKGVASNPSMKDAVKRRKTAGDEASETPTKVPLDDEPVSDPFVEDESMGKKTTRAEASETPTNASGKNSTLDKYRLPYESEELWELRRLFLEKNLHVLPEDELECLSHVFLNIETIRCRYPPETMALVAELSCGIATKYRRTRCNMLQRTFVSATSVATAKVRGKSLMCPANDDAGPSLIREKERHTQSMVHEPGHCVPTRDRDPQSLEEMLRNVIICNNSFMETMQALPRLGIKCGWNLQVVKTKQGHEACVKVGQFVIAKVFGSVGGKLLEKQAKSTAMDFLKKHCYTLMRVKQANEMDGVKVISKTGSEADASDKKPDEPEEPVGKLGSSNIGFKLMEKLGWTGGALGTRGDGIVDPVLAGDSKTGRRGFGHAIPIDSSTCSLKGINKQLIELREGYSGNHLVFSTEYSKEQRAKIHQMVKSVGGLQSKSVGSEKAGTRQLIVFRPELSLHEILRKVLVDKDPVYCEMYKVISPNEYNS